MKIVWIMMVLVFADGQWRQWNTYSRQEECEEARQLLIHYRENKMTIICEPVQISEK